MIGYYGAVIFGYSIIFAAAFGLIRFKKIMNSYQPFIFIIWLGLLNLTLSVILNETIRNNAVNSNIYVLLESLLYLWLFKNWRTFSRKSTFIYSLVCFLVFVWIYDNLIRNQLTSTNSLFRIVVSFVLIFLSIGQVNKLIANIKKNLLYNSSFLICCGIIIYFSYKATVEVFYLIHLEASTRFYINISTIMVLVNCFVNLLFAWAVLWIPKKQKSILLR